MGLDSQDGTRLLTCEEHGGKSAAAKENKRQAYLQAMAFYEDLKDPKHDKVDKELQAQALIERIRTSKEEEFVELRQHLFDDGEQRSMKYEELRAFRPEIFIKNDDSSMIPDWTNINCEDTLEAQHVTQVGQGALLTPGPKTIVANRMILQTFANTFKAQEGSRPR